MGASFIAQIMKAEQEGEARVASAKKNRQARMGQAKEKAEAEVKAFKEEQEATFQREMGAKAKADPSADLRGATAREAEAVKRDYANNKDRVIQFVLQKVLEVSTSLTETQKQSLRMGLV